jgi:hypothetical protein
MMAFVEHDLLRSAFASPGGIDHHQGMIGDDQVGFAPRPLGALDEAAAVVGAAPVNAFAAAVGQSGRSGAPEQAREPAGQIAADHVAVLGVSGPAPDELGEDRGAAGKAALERVLEVEKAQIILAPLADDDPLRPLLGIGEQLGPSASSCR